MSKHTDSLYGNIDFIPDDNVEEIKKAREQAELHRAHQYSHSDSHHHHHHRHHKHKDEDRQEDKPQETPDNSSGKGFDTPGDNHEPTYEYQNSDYDHASRQLHRHRAHRHRSRHYRKRIGATRKKNKKWSKWKKILIGILIVLLCLILGLAIAFCIMRNMGKSKLLDYKEVNVSVPDEIDYEDDGRTIYYGDHVYELNTNIASVLFMGIDNTELKEDAVFGTAGQADALYLLTYNTTNGKIKVLCLNRDTLTDISRYDRSGKYHDSTKTQLCLAYAYGDGKKVSAQNQVTAVQRLIYNIPINAYYAIDLSAIKILNDAVGGVTLTPEYSFEQFVKGQEITLKGDMTETFVRYRDYHLLDDNLRRMSCQRLYLNAFASQVVSSIKEDIRVPLKLYQKSSDYTVTNLDTTELTYLASSLASQYSGMELIKTEGKYKMAKGDESAQFILNKDKFFETILDIFYVQAE